MSVEGLRAEPVQYRGHRTRDSLLAAAREVLEKYGIDEFSTALVAERSRKSIGTVYRYFEDREAILDAVLPGRRHSHEVLFERVRQVDLGYTADHDDERGSEWLLVQAQQRAERYRFAGDGAGDRRDLVAAVALTLAALEAHDRAALPSVELDLSDVVDGTAS